MSRNGAPSLRERSMSELNDGLLDELLSEPDGLGLSLYLTLRGPGNKADRIEFKNMLTKAYEDARELGLRRPEADELTSMVDQLYQAARSTAAGATVCVYRDRSRADLFRLGRPVEPLCVVGERFHLTPMLVDHTRRPWYVLCLSRKHVRLLRFEPDEMIEVDVAGMPRSMDEFLAQSDREKQLQSHSAGRASGSVDAAFHGSGSVADQRSRDAVRFIRAVATAIDRTLGTLAPAPLIVAAVDEEAAEFRHRVTHSAVVDVGIVGNPDRLGSTELREAAEPILIDLDHRDEQEQLDRHQRLDSIGRSVSGPIDVHTAAVSGLVETIMVGRGQRAWARPTESGGFRPLHDTPSAGDEDVIALAVRAAARSGARIVDVVHGDVPAGAAAILHYPRSN